MAGAAVRRVMGAGSPSVVGAAVGRVAGAAVRRVMSAGSPSVVGAAVGRVAGTDLLRLTSGTLGRLGGLGRLGRHGGSRSRHLSHPVPTNVRNRGKCRKTSSTPTRASIDDLPPQGGSKFLAPDELEPVIVRLRKAGLVIERDGEHVRVVRQDRLCPLNITTAPHPGFPTAMQAQMMARLCLADGRSVLTETIFENRFMHVPELQRMGADIKTHNNTAIVQGVRRLQGASVMATDLRASASLVIAGLTADGETTVRRVYHLDRGYERIEKKLGRVGADIERIALEGMP